MAYALYYFKDKSMEVGKSGWMDIEDRQETTSKNIAQCPGLEDEGGWVNVKWDKGRKKKDGPAIFPAKVLMLSDNYSDLCKKREEFIKGENIWKNTLKRKIRPNSRLISDVEEEDERPIKQKKSKKATCTPKEAADHMIEDLKKELMAKQACLESTTEYEESSDEDPEPRNWSKAQLQLKELKRENKRLKQGNYKEILDAIQELPGVVTKLKEVIENVNFQTSSPASPWSTPTRCPHQFLHGFLHKRRLMIWCFLCQALMSKSKAEFFEDCKSFSLHWGPSCACLRQRNTVLFKFDWETVWGTQRVGIKATT